MTRKPDRGSALELVERALRLPADQRPAWVRSAAHDAATADEAIAMLALVSTDLAIPSGTDPVPPLPTLAGFWFGDFRLVRPIGAGAGGVVYEAEQGSPRRIVALKVMRARGALAATRAEAEAQHLARVGHPGIAAVYASGMGMAPDGSASAWIAMELVPGARSIVDAASDDCHGDGSAVARLLLSASEAIGAAHAVGIVHRDIKPANILVARDGRTKVVDFGLAGAADAPASPAGTPRWIAPERLDGSHATPRSDVWSLGRVIDACADAARLPPRHAIRSVAKKACDPDPAHRYADAADVASDLRALLDGEPMRCRPPGPLARIAFAAKRRPRASLAVVLAGAAATAAIAVALASRIGSDAAMLVELQRMLTMHDQVASMVDSIAEPDREAAGLRAAERAVDAMSDPESGPDGILNSFAVLVRLGQVQRACEIAQEGERKLRSLASEDQMRWLGLAAAGCAARSPDSGSAEVASLAESLDALSARSPADDFLLGCYIETMAVQANDDAFRRLALRLDRDFNPDPCATAAGTMLALVAMADARNNRQDPERLASIGCGIRRWSTWPVRDYNSVAYMNLLLRAFAAAAARGDRPAFDDAVPLARLAAECVGRAEATLVVEIWIGSQLSNFGDFEAAARTLDSVEKLDGLEDVDPERFVAWLPHRTVIALRSPAPRKAIAEVLRKIDAMPVLGGGDPELLEALRSWDRRDPEWYESIERWSRRGGHPSDWGREIRAKVADRLREASARD